MRQSVDLVALVRATASNGPIRPDGWAVGQDCPKARRIALCWITDRMSSGTGLLIRLSQRIRSAGAGEGDAPDQDSARSCQMIVHAATQICPECGFQFPAPTLNHAAVSYGGAMLSSQVVAEWL
jgi:hypothetical protein